MISDIRIHSSHETARDSTPACHRSLPLMCPNCQKPIQLSIGLCGNRLIEAILLQAGRIGAELECHQCGLRFVFHRTHQPRLTASTEANRSLPALPAHSASSSPVFSPEIPDTQSPPRRPLHLAPGMDWTA